MQELKILSGIVIACSLGVVVSLGGGIYTAWKENKEYKQQVIPAEKVAVPATAQ